MRIYIFFLAIIMAICPGNVHAQKITVTLAGTGISGFNGDGKAGDHTNLGRVSDICIDQMQNIYFVDYDNHRVRKISAATGIVTTIAGGGTSAADGIPATDASMTPNYMCMDDAGNIYVTGGHVKKIDAATGLISTVTGIGPGGSPEILLATKGICIDASNNLYVAYGPKIRKYTAATGIISDIAGTGVPGYTGDGGPATAATLNGTIAICVNASGDIYFSDQNGNRIRKIDGTTGIISWAAGIGGMAGTDGGPAFSIGVGTVLGLCVDNSGNIIIDDDSCSSRRLDLSTNMITRLAGDVWNEGYNGDGTNSLLTLFNHPSGVCTDGTGSLYVADLNNTRVRKAIQLTHEPQFAFGRGQTFNPCPGYAMEVNKLLAVVDLDSAQSETWTMISMPMHGTVAGLPYTMLSSGQHNYALPSGIAYTASASYSGDDSFKVRVSDGTSSDTITIYAQVNGSGENRISSSGNTCEGATTSLSALYGGGTWSTSNTNASIDAAGILTGITAGTVTVSYTLSGSCAGMISTVVTVNPLPYPGIISGIDHIYVGEAATLNITLLDGTWSSSNTAVATIASTGLSTGEVLGITAGTSIITHTTTDPHGCSAHTEFNITVMAGNSSTNINDITNNNSISVIPNPAHDKFTVRIFTPIIELANVTVTDIAGRLIAQFSGNTAQPITAILHEQPGIYLLHVSTEHSNTVQRLVID